MGLGELLYLSDGLIDLGENFIALDNIEVSADPEAAARIWSD